MKKNKLNEAISEIYYNYQYITNLDYTDQESAANEAEQSVLESDTATMVVTLIESLGSPLDIQDQAWEKMYNKVLTTPEFEECCSYFDSLPKKERIKVMEIIRDNIQY